MSQLILELFYLSRNVWTHLSIRANDQLRQRVAFALNQVFPIVKPYFGPSEDVINYHDIFVRNAFTNWKDILREISYSPLMALNLSYLRSKSMAYVKETLNQTSFADENFAREVSDRAYDYFFFFLSMSYSTKCLSISTTPIQIDHATFHYWYYTTQRGWHT